MATSTLPWFAHYGMAILCHTLAVATCFSYACQGQPRGTSPLGGLLKPGFHITPEYGWANDPNAPFLAPDGALHYFYQWNPNAPVWGAPYWAHVMTYDLAHWTRLPVALVPDSLYDYDGAFSGSASIKADGQPVLLYTGVSHKTELDFYYAMQAAAVPANTSDPTFQRWIKSPLAGMILPNGGTAAQFRDPVAAWTVNGTYYSIVGTQVGCIGSASLYSSQDLTSWAYDGVLASQVGLGLTTGTCQPPAMPQPGMGRCDQFGRDCRMWECPDYFEVDGAYVIKWSDQETGRTPYSADWYVLTDKEPDFSDWDAIRSSAGIFQPTFAGKPAQPRRIDYGSVYASTSFDANGRRLWAGWVYETSANCTQTCSTGTAFTESLGWQGVQTLLREVTVDEGTGSLLMNPLPELAALRTKQLFSGTVLSLQSAARTQAGNLHRGPERQLELWANFSVPAQPGPFSGGFTLSTGPGSETFIGFNGTAISRTDVVSVQQASVYVDRLSTGGMTNTTTEGGDIILPATAIQLDKLELHCYVDRSIIEVFALSGRGRVASRIYPDSQGDWSVSVYGDSAADVIVWSLEDMWMLAMS